MDNTFHIEKTIKTQNIKSQKHTCVPNHWRRNNQLLNHKYMKNRPYKIKNNDPIYRI